MNLKLDPKTVAEKYSGNLEGLKKKIRAVQSRKSTLASRKNVVDYQAAMDELLQEEEILKEARKILAPKTKPVTEFTAADIEKLDYDSTRRAKRSIQSTKCLTSVQPEDKSRYEQAKKIEELLKKHEAELKPVEDGLLKKKDLITVLDSIKTAGPEMTIDKAIEMIEKLL